MAGKPLEKARSVREEVDRFYRAFIRARDFCLGSKHAHRHKTKERHDAGFDTAVIGFWQKDTDKPRIVCSVAGMSMISEICQKKQRLLDTKYNTSKRRQEFNEMWDDFQRHVLRRLPEGAMKWIGDRPILNDAYTRMVHDDMNKLAACLRTNVERLRRNKELLSPRPGDLIGEQVAKDLRSVPRAFDAGEAEAYMTSRLIREKWPATVHFYGRWSPCMTCSPSLKWLSYLYGPYAPKDAPLPPDFQWQIGWVFYGEIYEPKEADQRDCNNELDWATKLGGIAGHELLLKE